MFSSYPSYDFFRTLRLSTPHMVGEDVYALQTALIACGFPLPRFGADGDLGSETVTAVKAAQEHFFLVVDGLAGGTTQRALALRIAAPAQAKYNLPDGALRGQIEHESSFRLGAYSVRYPNGSYDAGVTQRNTALTPPKEGFAPDLSITALAARVRQYFDLFGGVPLARRWALAQGSWNAPAFACYIAREEGATVSASLCSRPTDTERLAFEAYVTAVNKYV